jgi:D-sedoheptulose 7-phosphate isomerase
MSLQDRLINHFSDAIQVHHDAMISLCELIDYAGQNLVNTLLADKKLFVCGQGLAMSNALLLAGLLNGQFNSTRPALPIIILGADTALLSLSGYDTSNMLTQALRALAQAGDSLVIYGDTQESDYLKALINSAHDQQVNIIMLIGNSINLSHLLKETDSEIRIPSENNLRVHELQVLITHCLCDLIEQQLFGVSYV